MKALQHYLKTHPKTHLIFDFDETIFELILPWHKWHEFGFSRMRDIDPHLHDGIVNGTVDWHIGQNELVQKHGQVAREIIVQNSERFETELLQGVRVNEELVLFIQKNNYTQYVWTTNTRPVIERVLRDYSLQDSFKKSVTRSELDYIKPDPSGFTLLHDDKTPIDNYLFVGDSANDKAAATALGIDFFQIAF